MIDFKELRVGNYILHKGKVDFMIAICEGGSCTENYGNGVYEEDTEPIPLTGEWLLKFGFELKRKTVSMNVGGELFNYAQLREKDGTRGIVIWHSERRGWTINGVTNTNTHYLNHVHQIQNLYFALTGKELEIK